MIAWLTTDLPGAGLADQRDRVPGAGRTRQHRADVALGQQVEGDPQVLGPQQIVSRLDLRRRAAVRPTGAATVRGCPAGQQWCRRRRRSSETPLAAPARRQRCRGALEARYRSQDPGVPRRRFQGQLHPAAARASRRVEK